MRPLSVSIEGFTAFRERQVIDLADLELFCITGPTGAGKTTIFDAIAFALYGRAPRVEGQVRRLVASGRNEASVELVFRAAGATHRVARSIRRSASGAAGHRALLQDLVDGEWRAAASGPDAVTRCCEAITGLDFAAFRRAVMLPQGEFAEFLAGRPAERRAIMTRLLDLGRFEEAGRRARERARGLAATAESLRGTVEAQLADATARTVAAARRTHRRASQRAAQLAAAVEAGRAHADWAGEL
ncbi:MAG: SMC family ATPase, partial [Actinomycetota bacterium]